MKKKIEKFYYMSRMIFLEHMSYSKALCVEIIGSLVSIFLYYYLWKIVFEKTDRIAGFTTAQMTTYVIFSKILASQFGKGINTQFSRWIASGDIAVELSRPVGIFTILFTRRMGEFGAYIVFKAIPVCAIGYIFLRGEGPKNMSYLLLFVISVLMSIAIMFYFEMITGLLSIYTLTHYGLGFAKRAALDLLSGGVVPLFLFPDTIANILSFLPFAGMVSVPIYIFLGKYSTIECTFYLGVELFWILVLWIITRFIYGHVIKKAVVQGG